MHFWDLPGGLCSPVLGHPHVEVVCFHWGPCILHSIYTVMLCFCLGEQVSGVEAPVLACDPVCQQFIMLLFHFYPRIKPTRAGDTRGNICNYLVILDLGNWWSIPWKSVHLTSEMDTYYFIALSGPCKSNFGNTLQ